jgi:LPS-assembly protein
MAPLLAAFFVFTPLSPVHSGDEESLPWEITADRLTRQKKPEQITAEGNVVLKQYQEGSPTGLAVEAETVQYNVGTNSVRAFGSVHLHDNGGEVHATEGEVDLESETGFFRDATLFWQETNLSASADLIEKTGIGSYHIVNGKITTCPLCKDKTPDWSVWGRDVKVTLNDYASLRHATFRIRDVPVFYLPALRIPIQREKKSGLLFPEYSSSDLNGFGIITPFFINLSPSYDMTLYPGYYSERGPLLAGEFRYLADINSRGTLMTNYLDDDLEDTPENDFASDGIMRTNEKRYWIRGKADHDFGNRLTAKLDLDLISDRDFLLEFKKGIIGFTRFNTYFLDLYHRGFQDETVPLRDNTLQLAKVWRTTGLHAEAHIVDDLRDEPGKTMPAWALPRIALSGLVPLLRMPVDLAWQTDYAYFWRDEGVGGHRLDLFPSLNGPINLFPYLEASYLLGLQEILYFIKPHDTASEALWDDGDFEHRSLYNLQFTAATTLSRSFDIALKDNVALYHAIRPELTYMLRQETGGGGAPTLDREDLAPERNWLQYSINNFFLLRRPGGDDPLRTNFSWVKISQVYDFDAGDRPFSDIAFHFTTRGFMDLFFDYGTSLSVYGEDLTTHNLTARYNNSRGDRFALHYHYKRHPDIESPYFSVESSGDSLQEIRGNIETRLTRLFSVKVDMAYSLTTDESIDSTFGLVYHNPCWTIGFAASRDTADDSFYLIFSLTGAGSPMDLKAPGY